MESNLNEGKQKLIVGNDLLYGVSITDSCLSIEETERILYETFKKLK